MDGDRRVLSDGASDRLARTVADDWGHWWPLIRVAGSEVDTDYQLQALVQLVGAAMGEDRCLITHRSTTTLTRRSRTASPRYSASLLDTSGGGLSSCVGGALGTPTVCGDLEHRRPAAGASTVRLWPPTGRRSKSSRPTRRPGRTSMPWSARRGAGTRCASANASSSASAETPPPASGTGGRRPPTSGPRCCASRPNVDTQRRIPAVGCWRTSAASRPAGAASNRAQHSRSSRSSGRGARSAARTLLTTGWVVACFVTRTPFRYTGVSRTLAKAAVEFARSRGAHAVESYAMVTQPGVEVTWGELHVGSRSISLTPACARSPRPPSAAW